MKRLLLLGGGHAHLEVMRLIGLSPLQDTEVTLISPGIRQVYSGMIPGWIAGHYSLDECTIRLDQLAEQSDCRFLQTRATAIDPLCNEVEVADGDRLRYDVLSINTGADIAMNTFHTDAPECVWPIRPLEIFAESLEHYDAQIATCDSSRIAIIGGGAASVELILALHHRYSHNHDTHHVQLTLITEGTDLLPEYPCKIRSAIKSEFNAKGIQIVLGSRAIGYQQGSVVFANGARWTADRIILATGPAAPDWVACSGLEPDQYGFIAVDEMQSSLSHDNVFAVGDIATRYEDPQRKSGVQAVRAGPALTENLRLALSGRSLWPHYPSHRALQLISTGDRRAIASWRGLSASGHWVWRWKDAIDRRFVARYASDNSAVTAAAQS